MRYQKLVHIPTDEWVWVRPVTEEERNKKEHSYMDYQTNIKAPTVWGADYSVLGVNLSKLVKLVDEFKDDPPLISLAEWGEGKHD